MSFGRPPSFMQFSAAPPDRGSFPLDHEGECKTFMQAYLNCLKENQNNNGKCREFSREYLECRMQKGLMNRDSFDNLGYGDLEKDSQSQRQTDQGKPSVASSSPSSAEASPPSKSASDSRPGVAQPGV